jgi:hypothetical protein
MFANCSGCGRLTELDNEGYCLHCEQMRNEEAIDNSRDRHDSHIEHGRKDYEGEMGADSRGER